MMNVSLLQQRAKKVSLQANLDVPAGKEAQLEVKFRYNYNVNYSDDSKHCKATIEQFVEAVDDPQRLCINISVEGVFETDPIENDEEKKDVHVRSYYLLFPYAQMLISQMCVAAGLPPLLIPPDKMTVESVVLGDSKKS